jgi:hypothetical protein
MNRNSPKKKMRGKKLRTERLKQVEATEYSV